MWARSMRDLTATVSQQQQTVRTEIRDIVANVRGVRGRFDGWPDYELIEVLVRNGVELREEHRLLHPDLCAICEVVFEGMPMPRMPQRPSQAELEIMDAAAVVIQYHFINHRSHLNRLRQIAMATTDRFLFTEGLNPLIIDSQIELLSFQQQQQGTGRHQGLGPGTSPMHDNNGNGNEAETPGRHMYMERMESRFNFDPDASRRSFHEADMEKPYEAPDLDTALLYSAFNQPRWGGWDGDPYDPYRTSLGRHCVIGGCGEQLDLWNEGMVSELGQFGAGITNYFKFLKWSLWIFVILACFSLPSLIINTYGSGSIELNDFVDLSLMSIGNLGDTRNKTTILIPQCEGRFQDKVCILDKGDLGYLYAFIDMCAIVSVLIGYAWLRSFEKLEKEHLDRATVSASDYSIYIPTLPKDASEAGIRAHFARVTGHAVAAVHLALNNGEVIKAYQRRGKLMRQRYEMSARIRYIHSHESNAATAQSITRPMCREREELYDEVKELESEITQIQQRMNTPIGAFVTFEREAGMRSALVEYSGRWGRWWFMKREMRYNGHFRLRCRQAPDPSLVLWENLEYTRVQRFNRQVVVSTIALFFIFVSIMFQLLARDYQQRAQAEGGTEYCPSGWSDFSDEEQREAVRKEDEILYCYCNQFELKDQLDDGLCREYFRANLLADSLTFLAGIVAGATNEMLGVVTRKLARFEMYHSIDVLEESVFVRSFFLKFVNLGLIVLVMSWRTLQEWANVNIETSEDFDTEWYTTAGISLQLTMMTNVFAPHAPVLWKLWTRTRKRNKLREKLENDEFVTQDQLNRAFLGPEFQFAVRYASTLTTFFVCIMYNTGIPLLSVVGAVSFAVTYAVDKYFFLTLYRSPPRFSEKLGRRASKLVLDAVIIHLAIGTWMLGNGRIFVSRTADRDEIDFAFNSYDPLSVRDKLKQKHILPLVVLFFILLAYRVGTNILGKVQNVSTRIVNLFTCGGTEDTDRLLDTKNAIECPYTRALDRGLLKGLATYNVLQNPKYKDAFAISDEFALLHSHVTSVRNFAATSSRRLGPANYGAALQPMDEGGVELAGR